MIGVNEESVFFVSISLYFKAIPDHVSDFIEKPRNTSLKMVSGTSSVLLAAGLYASFREEIGTVAIVFGNEIEILVAAAGQETSTDPVMPLLAMRIAWARACELSIAGMMPSFLDSRNSASIASSSPTVT